MKNVICGLYFLTASSMALAGGTCNIFSKGHFSPDLKIDDCKILGPLENKDNVLSGTFEVEVKGLNGGLRNKHMQGPEYLDSDKYPKIKLVLNPIKIADKHFSGTLTVKDKTKEISGDILSIAKDELKARFIFNITAFGIKQPKLGPAYIEENVTITAVVKP